MSYTDQENASDQCYMGSPQILQGKPSIHPDAIDFGNVVDETLPTRENKEQTLDKHEDFGRTFPNSIVSPSSMSGNAALMGDGQDSSERRTESDTSHPYGNVTNDPSPNHVLGDVGNVAPPVLTEASGNEDEIEKYSREHQQEIAEHLRKNGGGYHKLAELMENYPQYAIFRCFGKLNALNLLYMQAELQDMQLQLEQWTKENNALQEDCDMPDFFKHCFDTDWKSLSGQREGIPNSAEYKDHWDTALRMRALLERYNETLLVNARIEALAKPGGRQLDFVRMWKKHTSLGCVYLCGEDDDIWDNMTLNDSLTMLPPPAVNAFTDWTGRYVMYWLQAHVPWMMKAVGLVKPIRYEDTLSFAYNRIIRLSAFLTMLLGAAFPVMSMYFLGLATNTQQSIGIFATLTSAFACCMGLFSTSDGLETVLTIMAFAIFQVIYMVSSIGVEVVYK